MAQKRKQPKRPAVKVPGGRDPAVAKLDKWARQMTPWVAAAQAWMWDGRRQPACGAAAPAPPGTPVPLALLTRTQPPPPPPPKYPPD